MNVTCPECRSVFRVDPAKVTSEKLRARCSVCGGIIPVGKGASWVDAFSDVPAKIATPRAVSPALGSRPSAPSIPAVLPNERLTPLGSRPVVPVEASVAAAPPPAPAIVEEPVPASPPPVIPSQDHIVTAPSGVPVTDGVPVQATASIFGADFAPPPLPTPPASPAIAAAPEPAPIAAGQGVQDAIAVPFRPPVIAPLGMDAPPTPIVEPPAPNPSADVQAPTAASVTVGTGAATPVHPGRSTPATRGPLTPRRLTPIGGNPSYHRGPTRPASPAFGAPLPPPPRPSIPTPVAPAATVPAAASAAEPTTRRPINPFLANDPNAKARRLARALVSDMIVYHPAKREEGVRNGTLKQLFREEIKKSYEEYVEQVGRDFAEGTTHFQDALNDVLAGGRRLF
ncbi:MAG: zinc-ribbon domain-containing protein [Gemmatimonadaceae bacterium]